MEIQYKSVKMEMEMMEKDKNAEIARLTRRHEGKETGPDKELPMLVRKLEEEIREKEKRILVISHEF